MNATSRLRNGRLIALVIAAILLPIAGAFAWANHGHPTGTPWAPSGATSNMTSGGPEPIFPTPIRHIVEVILENTEASSVLAGAPYEGELAHDYAYLNQSYAVCHPSEPNYLAMITGLQTPCETGNYAVLDQWNLADQLETQGFTWKAYAESMPTSCGAQDVYPYAVRHNPFVFMGDIVSNATRCDAHVVGFSPWNSDVTSGNLPNFAFVIPNLFDDGHDTQFSYADVWLQN